MSGRGALWKAGSALAVVAAGAVILVTQAHRKPTPAQAGTSRQADTPVDADTLPPSAAEQAAIERAEKSPRPENLKALAKVRARHGLALLEVARKDKDVQALSLALTYALSAARLDEKNPGCWFLLAQIYAENPNSPAAVLMAQDAARRAFDLDPGNDTVGLFLGQVLFRQKFFDAALDCFEQVLARKGELAGAPVAAMMAAAYMLDGQEQRGQRFLTELVARRPEAHSARLALAIVLHNQRELEAAYAELEKVAAAPGASRENREYARKLIQDWPREETNEMWLREKKLYDLTHPEHR
jgi:tetratricopeptide (TPR) repeat protein